MENILVVDDEEAIREVVSTMLESKGYHCTAVQNGRVAQDQVKKLTPDLVLSDMIMPEMDGIRLLEWMRQYDPEVPVIMVTAIHDISTALEAIRRGAYDYILKPFEKDQLFLGVGRALQHRRLIIENRNYQRNLEQLVEERTAQAHRKARGTRAILRRHARGSRKRPGLEGCRNGGALPAGHRVLHIRRQSHARAGFVFGHPGARRFPPRYRQNGHSRWHSAQTGPPERRRKTDHAQTLRNRLQHADSHSVFSATPQRSCSRTRSFLTARATPAD